MAGTDAHRNARGGNYNRVSILVELVMSARGVSQLPGYFCNKKSPRDDCHHPGARPNHWRIRHDY